MHVIRIGLSYLERPWVTVQTVPRKWVALSKAIRLLQELPAPSAHLSTAHRKQAGEDAGTNWAELPSTQFITNWSELTKVRSIGWPKARPHAQPEWRWEPLIWWWSSLNSTCLGHKKITFMVRLGPHKDRGQFSTSCKNWTEFVSYLVSSVSFHKASWTYSLCAKLAIAEWLGGYFMQNIQATVLNVEQTGKLRALDMVIHLSTQCWGTDVHGRARAFKKAHANSLLGQFIPWPQYLYY